MPTGIYKHRPLSEKHKQHIAEALKNHPCSEESKLKISKSNKGKPSHNKGIPMTEEQKKKISDSHIGLHHTEESKNKMSGSRKGKSSSSKGRFGKDSYTWKGGNRLARLRINSRRRSLGHIFMNEPFENSEGHHLDNDFILYIPKELHRSIPHNLTTKKNMELINLKAFEWMISILRGE